MGDITGPKVYFEIPIFGGLPITETMVNAWIVMLIILILCKVLTHNMKKIPKGKQVLAEKAVTMVEGLVDQTMGDGCRAFTPYIITLMMFSALGSLVSLIHLRPVTGDLNTTLGWALITFFLILYSKIRFHGLGGFLKGLLEPVFIMAPLNVISDVATPLSMSFRHFGNIAGGLVITTLLLGALKALSELVLGFLPVPILQIGIPGVLSLYFDLFTACMQAFIFSMLTMAYVGDARSTD